jgi:hypothetical protein
MRIIYLLAISLFLSTNILSAQNKEVNTLLEKVHQAPNIKEKKELIEKLKEKLAKENKKARAKADAIIKAKSKIPLKIYSEKSLQK